MKILVLNCRDIRNPKAGGSEVHLHEIFKRIAKEHEVFLVSSKFSGCKNVEVIDGIKVFRVGNDYTFSLAAFWCYVKKLRHEHFDVVIDDITKVPLFTPLYIKGKPLMAIIHGADKAFRGIHGRLLYKELPLPLAIFVHILDIFTPFIYKNITIITASDGLSLREGLISLGFREHLVNAIPMGIDRNLYRPKFSSTNRFLVVYFGRIKNYKRVDHVVRAFEIVKRKVPEAELIIAGRGEYKELYELVQKLGLSHSVKLTGPTSEEEKIEILRRAWVLIATSMLEGWGIIVLEANLCGTPCIAYDVPGYRDSIKNEETGLLVPYGDIEKLALATIRVLGDEKLRRKLRRNALRWASNFSWDRSAREFMEILQKKLGN
ncbi:MAG: glycosyltransferase family 4 protein [Candidatus Heimdallarchaeota archaeon]